MKKLLIVLVFVLIVSGCKSNSVQNLSSEKDIEGVNVELTSVSHLESGDFYSFRVTNNSSRIIKHLELAIGLAPAEQAKESGVRNDTIFNAVAEKPYDIKVGESVEFKMRILDGIIQEDNFNKKDLEISVLGYFKKLEIKNRFYFSGKIENFTQSE